jgi:hypothetical protein
MSARVLGFSFAMIALAGAFGFAMTSDSNAEGAMTQCANRWKAAKANGTTDGKTWKEFFDRFCGDQDGASRGIVLSPAASAASSEAPPAQAATASAAPAIAAPAPATAPVAPAPSTMAAPIKKSQPTGGAASERFSTIVEAKAKCPSDTVVWVDNKSKVFYLVDHSDYHKTKPGAYMCKVGAIAAGARASATDKQL